MSYADLEELKSYLRLLPGDGDEIDDVELQRALDAASRQIDQVCSRTFAVAESGPPEDRGYHYDVPHWDNKLGGYVVEIPDLTSGSTGLEVFLWDTATGAWSTTAADITGAVFLPRNNTPVPNPWTQILLPSVTGYACAYGDALASTVLVRAYFGLLAVPTAVVEACLIQSARLARRRDALFGVINSPDGSSQMRLKQSVDSDALVLLDGYIKRWGAR